MRLNHVLVASLLFVAAGSAASYDGWAGGKYERGPAYPAPVNYAEGTFVVPTLTSDSQVGSGLVIGIGIDGGQTCDDAFFSAGINILKTDNGVDIKPWAEFYPPILNWIPPESLMISSGHRLTIIVEVVNPAESLTKVFYSIANEDTDSSWSDELDSLDRPLCRKNAVWVVGVVPLPVGQRPLANFGQVTFMDRFVKAPGLRVLPLYFNEGFNEIQENQRTMTTTMIEEYTTANIIVSYTG